MNFFDLTRGITVALLITACGGETPSSTPVPSNSTTVQLDAGSDKYIQIDKTVHLVPKTIPHKENVSSYEWSENEEVLATTSSFDYMATTLGVKVLNFSVLYSDGKKITDSLKVIVTSKHINMTIPPISDTLKTAYLKEINQARATQQDCHTEGIFEATTKLTWSEKLYHAAYEHTQDLVTTETFEHEGSGTQSDWTGYTLGKKSDLIERAENYGYQWHRLGENLAGGTTMDTPQKAIAAWLKSDGHCANLMNPNFTEVGMVRIKKEDSKYTHYWSQEFGTPK